MGSHGTKACFLRTKRVLNHPKVVVFVYKRILDEISRLHFGRNEKAIYGFNPDLEIDFAPVFAFPLPGVGGKLCDAQIAKSAMQQLRDLLEASG